MNKTDQQKNNTYINYWKPNGIAQRELNASTKIEVVTNYTIIDKDGKEIQRTRITKRQPTAKDVSFEKKISKEVTKLTNEQKEMIKLAKQERMDKLPFSKLHKELIANMYHSTNWLKRTAIEAAHESKITKILIARKANKTFSKARNKQNCPNLVVLRMYNSKGLPYDFSVTPSYKSTKELFKEVNEMNTALSKSTISYAGAQIWNKENYMMKLNPRYTFFRDKEVA